MALDQAETKYDRTKWVGASDAIYRIGQLETRLHKGAILAQSGT